MLLLGLLVVLGVGGTIAVLVADNRLDATDHTWTAFGNDLVTTNAVETLLAGFALGVLFCLGLVLIALGARRSRRRAADLREMRREAEAAAAERDALANRLAVEEAARDTTSEPAEVPGPHRRWTPGRTDRVSDTQRF